MTEQHHPTALTESMRRAEQGDFHDPEAVAYHLNTQRTVISHTAAVAQELELRLYELKTSREVLEKRAQRTMNEIKDIDRAAAQLTHALNALRSQ